jgi:hypothetical protein
MPICANGGCEFRAQLLVGCGDFGRGVTGLAHSLIEMADHELDGSESISDDVLRAVGPLVSFLPV